MSSVLSGQNLLPKGLPHKTRSLTSGLSYHKSKMHSPASTLCNDTAIDADNMMYKKARIFIQSRPKRVLFNVHHHLYQSGNLKDDVKRLKNDQYEGVAPPTSIIWGERFDQNVLQHSKELNEDNFWSFVHSVAWSKFSSIRITDGALLDSILFTYYTLVRDGQLFSCVTRVFQDNLTSSNPNSPKDESENIKITFTYFAPTLKALSDIIYSHHGSRINADSLTAQNDSHLKFCTESPETLLDSSRPNDQNPASSSSRPTQHTPINPPNTPSPSTSLLQTFLKKRKDKSRQGGRQHDAVQYPSSYYNLPLLIRNRFTLGRKLKGDDGMSVEGKSLQHQGDTSRFKDSSTLYFTHQSGRVSGYKSSYHGARESLGKRFHMKDHPSISLAANKNEMSPMLGKNGDNSSPLHSCLVSPNHQQKEKAKKELCHENSSPQRPDPKRHLVFSPNLEYINLVRQVASEPSKQKPPQHCVFNTKKLFINWSLEKIRQQRGRKGKTGPSQKQLLRKLEMQQTDKEYVLEKFLGDQSGTPRRKSKTYDEPDLSDQCRLHSIKVIQCEQCRREKMEQASDPAMVTNHDEIHRLRFLSLPPIKQISQAPPGSIPPGFADTNSDFKHGCLKSTQSFIIRKEQITTSRSFHTITSLTINKIPSLGFINWQYKTDEAILEKQ